MVITLPGVPTTFGANIPVKILPRSKRILSPGEKVARRWVSKSTCVEILYVAPIAIEVDHSINAMVQSPVLVAISVKVSFLLKIIVLPTEMLFFVIC